MSHRKTTGLATTGFLSMPVMANGLYLDRSLPSFCFNINKGNVRTGGHRKGFAAKVSTSSASLQITP
jgi:hypothetical protein